MAPRTPPPRTAQRRAPAQTAKLAFNADAAAIGIALLLAALVRLNVVPHIGW